LKFLRDDDDRQSGKIAGLDVAEIAELLSRVTPDGDAYDVLRNALTMLTGRARQPQGTTTH
jgi:hypothetical protein